MTSTPQDDADITPNDGDVEESEPTDDLDDDERTVRRLLQGAQNPPGDIERGAAGLPDKHLNDDDPVWKNEDRPV